MKGFSKYHYLLSFLLPLLTLAGLLLGSWFVYLPLLHIALYPLLDIVLGRSRAQAKGRESFFKFILYGHVLIYTVLIGVFLFKIGQVPFLSLAWWAMVAGVGMSAFMSAIAPGHELIHSQLRLERSLGRWLLLLTNYVHFDIEHPKTPPCARRHEEGCGDRVAHRDPAHVLPTRHSGPIP